MKNIVRGLVVALALTGAIATSYAKAPSAATISGKTSAMPIPACPPDGSTGCGMY